MGRPALTDAEKREKGTFDPRYSAEARAAAAAEKVVSFPELVEIPSCRFRLTPGGHGEKVYTELMRRLHEQRRLTMMMHLKVEAIAAGIEDIHRKVDEGLRVPATAYTTLLQAVEKIERMNVDRAFPGSSAESTNKFSRNGFAQRKA